MKRLRVVLGVLVVGLLAATACAPVVPSIPVDSWEFDGFEVYSVIPEDPVGLVFVFHGSSGSADIATKVEPTDALNELVDRGYGWVSTSSTERTGSKRWNVSDRSFTTNPDLKRLAALYAEIVATTDVSSATPVFGIGMSNGARMVTLFGQRFADLGLPVGAIGAYSGRVANPVLVHGGLTVPTFFSISENDTVVDNDVITEEYQATAASGTPAVLRTAPELPLFPRFTRIPSVDADEQAILMDWLLGLGVWNADGERVVDFDDAVTALLAAEQEGLPDGVVTAPNEVANQVAVTLAEHQFSALHKKALADFFDTHNPLL